MVRTGFTFKVTLAIKPPEREAETETLRKRGESEQTKRIHDNLENERRRGPKPEWGGRKAGYGPGTMSGRLETESGNLKLAELRFGRLSNRLPPTALLDPIQRSALSAQCSNRIT